jgi:uncharacterized protein
MFQAGRYMTLAAVKVKFHIPFSHSLKDKRMVARSLMDKVRNRYNVSISEVEEMDTLQTLVIGIAYVSNSPRLAERVLDEVIRFMEDNTEAHMTDMEYMT